MPIHLRDRHFKGAQSLGHGSGYAYPHDYPEGLVDQQYLPDELLGTRYYVPQESDSLGMEGQLKSAAVADKPGHPGGQQA